MYLILLITIVVDYFAGIYIAKTEGPKRKLYLIISLIANIGFFSFFKYYDFLNRIFNDLTACAPAVHERFMAVVAHHRVEQLGKQPSQFLGYRSAYSPQCDFAYRAYRFIRSRQ